MENGGKLSMLEPDSIRIIAPGNAIKKPKAADVPTASYIFFENIVNVGTLKPVSYTHLTLPTTPYV